MSLDRGGATTSGETLSRRYSTSSVTHSLGIDASSSSHIGKIDSKNSSVITKALSNKDGIVDLSCVKLELADLEFLTSEIKKNPKQIRSLDITFSGLSGGQECNALMQVLQLCDELKLLNLSHNSLDELAMPALLEFCQKNPSIKFIKLTGNPIAEPFVKQLLALEHLHVDFGNDSYHMSNDILVMININAIRYYEQMVSKDSTKPKLLHESCGHIFKKLKSVLALYQQESTQIHRLLANMHLICGEVFEFLVSAIYDIPARKVSAKDWLTRETIPHLERLFTLSMAILTKMHNRLIDRSSKAANNTSSKYDNSLSRIKESNSCDESSSSNKAVIQVNNEVFRNMRDYLYENHYKKLIQAVSEHYEYYDADRISDHYKAIHDKLINQLGWTVIYLLELSIIDSILYNNQSWFQENHANIVDKLKALKHNLRMAGIEDGEGFDELFSQYKNPSNLSEVRVDLSFFHSGIDELQSLAASVRSFESGDGVSVQNSASSSENNLAMGVNKKKYELFLSYSSIVGTVRTNNNVVLENVSEYFDFHQSLNRLVMKGKVENNLNLKRVIEDIQQAQRELKTSGIEGRDGEVLSRLYEEMVAKQKEYTKEKEDEIKIIQKLTASMSSDASCSTQLSAFASTEVEFKALEDVTIYENNLFMIQEDYQKIMNLIHLILTKNDDSDELNAVILNLLRLIEIYLLMYSLPPPSTEVNMAKLFEVRKLCDKLNTNIDEILHVNSRASSREHKDKSGEDKSSVSAISSIDSYGSGHNYYLGFFNTRQPEVVLGHDSSISDLRSLDLAGARSHIKNLMGILIELVSLLDLAIISFSNELFNKQSEKMSVGYESGSSAHMASCKF